MEYLIGELAKISGSSTKAIRLYEKKGLLAGKRNETNQYRVFEEEALVQLQRIQMLQFLGFSLEQIKSFMEQFDDLSLEKSFREQKRLLEVKREILDSMISCVGRAADECIDKTFSMDLFFERMNAIQKNRKADELVWQLSRLSDEPKGWSRWIYQQAQIPPNSTILDAGAGWGNLWRYNRDCMENTMKITCVDYHNTHADSLEKYVEDENLDNFTFIWDDLETLTFAEKYDRIFFNHVLPFIKEPLNLYKKFKESLSEKGIFICTWGGSLLFENLYKLLIDYPRGASYFHEKGRDFKTKIHRQEEDLQSVFESVECQKYFLDLSFENVEKLADYIIMLMHVDAKNGTIRKELLHYLETRVPETDIKIKRDTCLYLCSAGGEGKCHLD